MTEIDLRLLDKMLGPNWSGGHTMIFADPYKKCLQCGQWVDGAEDVPGPLLLIPCGHRCHYRDVCPSWGPVDGCTCAHTRPPNVHEQREPEPDDVRTFRRPVKNFRIG
jgi:hypothetical protein